MRWATSADSAISLKLKGWVAAARRLSMPWRRSTAQISCMHGSREATARRLKCSAGHYLLDMHYLHELPVIALGVKESTAKEHACAGQVRHRRPAWQCLAAALNAVCAERVRQPSGRSHKGAMPSAPPESPVSRPAPGCYLASAKAWPALQWDPAQPQSTWLCAVTVRPAWQHSTSAQSQCSSRSILWP